MDILIELACGLDVHKKSITACVMTPEGKEVKTFRTHTVFLLDLIDWTKQHRCTHVAMESTGVFCKPIVNLLEAEEIQFLVVTPSTSKQFPAGRRMSRMRSGFATCCGMGCLSPAIFRIAANAKFVNWSATVET